jgi:ring-1,2-phenylacetyl-CoA epoxidase subunit PaaD
MVTTADTVRELAAQVLDPELPLLTIAELGVLRGVETDAATGRIVVTITPTYSGCPALDAIRADLQNRLHEFGNVEVRTVLHPPWTTDWITESGRRKLVAAGIAPPAPVGERAIQLVLTPPPRTVRCPHCGSADTVELSRFGATPCKALRSCRACHEPFEHFKEL